MSNTKNNKDDNAANVPAIGRETLGYADEILELSQMLSATRPEDKERGRAIAKRLNEIFAPCSRCNDTGINHGVQCKPTKRHPYGWKSEDCDCGA